MKRALTELGWWALALFAVLLPFIALTIIGLAAAPSAFGAGYEGLIQCATYPRRETTIVRLPRKVAALVICTAPGTTRAGVPVQSMTVFGVTRKGKTHCTTDMLLESQTGAVIWVERNECGYPP